MATDDEKAIEDMTREELMKFFGYTEDEIRDYVSWCMEHAARGRDE